VSKAPLFTEQLMSASVRPSRNSPAHGTCRLGSRGFAGERLARTALYAEPRHRVAPNARPHFLVALNPDHPRGLPSSVARRVTRLRSADGLPSSVTGPVLRRALRRLASICREEVILPPGEQLASFRHFATDRQGCFRWSIIVHCSRRAAWWSSRWCSRQIGTVKRSLTFRPIARCSANLM
jgi:hypothetical protein